ncbi:MAG TPA: F0F1 ATP synthase subunit alpha, partial [Polyangiaceae bacterium]|nr:F0F1 ATP synthase subunit alpha [Polyangiaceae bacterium]
MPRLLDEVARRIDGVRRQIDALQIGAREDHFGRVVAVGDGVASVEGLAAARLDERLRFEDGSAGMAVTLDADRVGCVLLGGEAGVQTGTRVHGTGEVVQVPVGEALLGRVIDPLGQPLDGLAPPEVRTRVPAEQPAPAIVDRDLVEDPLYTGLAVIDAMIPLGRGQRQLIIGDRQTGKTSVAVDTMIRQRHEDVICVYCAIGEKTSTSAQVIEAIRAHGAPQRCLFVIAAADAPPGLQWLAPFAACAMAEWFRDRGQHALLVLDDLTRHADVHRQISLLLRQPPGREAYPGDVFYLHARLLERATRLSPERGGGSLTALPIAETRGGNLTAYIPTNLVSITDGQIYLEPRLF